MKGNDSIRTLLSAAAQAAAAVVAAAALAVGTLAPGAANAAPIVNNDFTTASRTSNPQGGTPTSGATAITGLDAVVDSGGGVPNSWNGTSNDYVVATNNHGGMAGVAGGPSFFDAINVAPGITGNSLRVNNLAVAYSISTYFTPQALGNGDSVSVSFNVRTSLANPTAAGANNFGLGLFNSGGSRLTANQSAFGSTAFDDDTGYQARYNANATATTTTLNVVSDRASSLNQNIFQGSFQNLTGTSAAGGAVNFDENYPVLLTITRSADGLKNTITTSFAGATGTFEDTTSPHATFDHLAIFFGSQWGAASPNQRTNFVDDVVVTYTPVPEPAGLAAVGLAGAGLLVRRQRSASL